MTPIKPPDNVTIVCVLLICAFFLGRCYAQYTTDLAGQMGEGPAEAFP